MTVDAFDLGRYSQIFKAEEESEYFKTICMERVLPFLASHISKEVFKLGAISPCGG